MGYERDAKDLEDARDLLAVAGRTAEGEEIWPTNDTNENE